MKLLTILKCVKDLPHLAEKVAHLDHEVFCEKYGSHDDLNRLERDVKDLEKRCDEYECDIDDLKNDLRDKADEYDLPDFDEYVTHDDLCDEMDSVKRSLRLEMEWVTRDWE